MRKILAAIVEYKLDKNDLIPVLQRIIIELNSNDTSYPTSLKDKMTELVSEIQDIYHQDILSFRDEEYVMDTLKEMERLIVDYLSQSSVNQTNDCISN